MIQICNSCNSLKYNLKKKEVNSSINLIIKNYLLSKKQEALFNEQMYAEQLEDINEYLNKQVDKYACEKNNNYLDKISEKKKRDVIKI